MFLGCGVGAFSAGIFHLMTHAFFKALLFLSAGSVIHAMGGEQDMWQMGGLRSKIKLTFWYHADRPRWRSPDSAPLQAFSEGRNSGGGIQLSIMAEKFCTAWDCSTALMTSFYMFRLMCLTFFGQKRYEQYEKLKMPER